MNWRYWPALVTALAIAGSAIILSFRPIYEPDLWWHLAHGRENAAGTFVRTNLFSFAYSDYRQPYTSWLFDTTAFLAWRAIGPIGIQLLQALLLGLTLTALYAACRTRAPAAARISAASVLLIAFFILEPRAIPRPHLASFAGMALCTWLVERAIARRSAAPLYWSVPAVALWSNVHVECVFGVLLIWLFAASEMIRPAVLTRHEARRAAAAALGCAGALLANPYGWGLLAYLYENRSVPRILTIAELEPPPLPAYRAFYVYLAVLGALAIWQWRMLRLWEIASGVFFASLGLRFLRLTPLVLLATAPFVASGLALLSRRRRQAQAMLFAAICAGLLVSRVPVRLLVTELTAGSRAVEPDAFFSANAIAFARDAGLEGPVFNSHNLGGYLAWKLYPRVQIFQDSRLQAYPPELFLSILVASQSQSDWDVLVADVDWAIVSRPRPNQLSGVGMFPVRDWPVVFRDDAVEIVVRRAGKFGRLAEAR